MSIATFRETLRNISTPWLLGYVSLRVGYAIGLVTDALAESTRVAIKARMPGVCDTTALPYLGRDRGIDQGPSEDPVTFAGRLSNSMVSVRRKGTAWELLRQLRYYFAPSFISHLYMVSDRATWHAIDASGATTKTIASPSNWKWDQNAFGIAGSPRWWRVWLVLDGTSWLPESVWGGGTWGDGGSWGSTASPAEVSAVRRMAARWRSEGTQIVNIIVSFTPGMFAPGNAPGGIMPAGAYDQPATRVGVNAAFWDGAP